MLVKCGVRSGRNAIKSTIKGRRSASSGTFVGSDVVIPPESPRYVYLPQPVQQFPVVKTQRKGTLPKPRTPLKRTKAQLPWHLENTAPQRVLAEHSKDIPSIHKDHVEWKAKESNLRRKNFLEGYKSLRSREAGWSGKRRGQPNPDRPRSQMAPEPSYETMSRPSVLSYMSKPATWRTAKPTKEQIEASRARYAELEQAKEYERRTGVHTLYVNAKNFIVNTEQLEERLSKVFDSEFYEYNKNKHYGVWDEQGWPEDTAYLMERSQSTQDSRAVTEDIGYTETARKRIMKVTEEMTGGKLVHEGRDLRSR